MMARRSLAVRAAAGALLGVATLAAGVLVFAWSGVYNIAASQGHWAVTDWFLTFGMRSSVRTHAAGIETPPLEDNALVQLGAAYYHSGCAVCHGAPDAPASPITAQMLPAPPSLWRPPRSWRPRELFFIVKHGIKYAGMPGWVGRDRDDEVWAMVAFLVKLPSMSVEAYRSAVIGDRGQELETTATFSFAGGRGTLEEDCARCHGKPGDRPRNDLVPRLDNQTETNLLAALDAYARGERESGIMEPVAAGLDENLRLRLARYYAGTGALASPAPFPASAVVDTRGQVGRELAETGNAARSVPACLSCHGAERLGVYPALDGQGRRYLVQQLQIWKRGGRRGTALARLMAPLAERLTDEEIEAVASYFAGREPPDERGRAAPR